MYEWSACSDLTPSMMGPPEYPYHPVPTWEEFCADWKPYYFDGSRPEMGRCFIITAGQEPIGVVSYSLVIVDNDTKHIELDIWLRSEKDCGKGHGSEALEALCALLHNTLDISRFVIRPSARNRRAIAAYQKAGFPLLDLSPEEQMVQFDRGDYPDTVTLVKEICLTSQST